MQIKRTSYMQPSKSQTYLTPDRVYGLIKTNYEKEKKDLYDPCPPYTPYKAPIFFNGLYGSWKEWNYVNPPFKTIILEQFVEKAISQAKKGNSTIMLLPAKTDQQWFHQYIIPIISKVVWIRKRIVFKFKKHNAPGAHFLILICPQ